MAEKPRFKYTFVANKVTFTSANTTLHNFPCQLLGLFGGLLQDLRQGNQTGSYKTKGDKKGLNQIELYPVLSWTERRDGICGLATVLLYFAV